MRENIDTTNNFSFDLINPECISKIINNLDTSKATQKGDIPTKIIKDNKDFFSYFISASFNNAVNKGVFPDELKHADIKPIYKKESRNEKGNYRPVSILANLSKISERSMYDQLKDYFDKLLLKYQCGFRKGLSTQHCLLAILFGVPQGSILFLTLSYLIYFYAISFCSSMTFLWKTMRTATPHIVLV